MSFFIWNCFAPYFSDVIFLGRVGCPVCFRVFFGVILPHGVRCGELNGQIVNFNFFFKFFLGFIDVIFWFRKGEDHCGSLYLFRVSCRKLNGKIIIFYFPYYFLFFSISYFWVRQGSSVVVPQFLAGSFFVN